MNRVIRRALLALTGLGAALALTFAFAHAQSGTPQSSGTQTPSPGPAVKKAPEVYKNIQVMKDVDADKWIPTMQLIANSLGAECEMCHVQEKDANGVNHTIYEKDDKPAKLTARKMMQMTMDINKNSFNGQRKITCFSCHRGAEQPVPTPIIPDGDVPRAEPLPANLPTADQILEKYTQALGGADALQKVTTRMEKGNVIFGTNKTPVEVYAKAPGKRVTVTRGPNGDSYTAFDGIAGWLQNGTRPATDMSAADSAISKVNADFFLVSDAKQMFQRMRVLRPEKIGDRDMYVIIGANQGQTPVRMFFDQQTGLLARVIQYVDTGLGLNPVEVNYSDYRDANGIKVPFHWQIARPLGHFDIQIDELHQNVPIDDSKFTKPAGQ